MTRMWNDFKPEEIVGEDKTIDKLGLVRDFLNQSNCKEIPLTDAAVLLDFLKNEIKWKFGVYCIYNEEKNEVLYVGKSKNLRRRIRSQLIGVKGRKDKTRPLKFPRLFLAFLKSEYNNMQEKEYNALPDRKKKEYIKSYQNKIFGSGNILRLCFTRDHLRAIVLEHTLIKYYKSKGQCKYNFQV